MHPEGVSKMLSAPLLFYYSLRYFQFSTRSSAIKEPKALSIVITFALMRNITRIIIIITQNT